MSIRPLLLAMIAVLCSVAAFPKKNTQRKYDVADSCIRPMRRTTLACGHSGPWASVSGKQ